MLEHDRKADIDKEARKSKLRKISKFFLALLGVFFEAFFRGYDVMI